MDPEIVKMVDRYYINSTTFARPLSLDDFKAEDHNSLKEKSKQKTDGVKITKTRPVVDVDGTEVDAQC